jgi:hypothetical protein
MGRFYFHLQADDQIVPDDEGVDLPDLSAAEHEAILAARELLAEEAAHIRASRFELIKMVQIFLRIGTERETSSHEASDNFCFRVCRTIRRRDRYAAVSFDRDVRRDRC